MKPEFRLVMGQTESGVQRKVSESKQEPVNILLSEEVFNRLTREPSPAMRESEGEPSPATSLHYMQTASASSSATNVYQVDNAAVADQESEFTKNKNYWKKRLEDLQDTQEKIKVILQTEREKGFQDAQASLLSTDEESSEKPCADNLGAVTNCYKGNTKEPMACDKEVDEFVSCVRTAKMDSMDPEKKKEPKKEEPPKNPPKGGKK